MNHVLYYFSEQDSAICSSRYKPHTLRVHTNTCHFSCSFKSLNPQLQWRGRKSLRLYEAGKWKFPWWRRLVNSHTRKKVHAAPDNLHFQKRLGLMTALGVDEKPLRWVSLSLSGSLEGRWWIIAIGDSLLQGLRTPICWCDLSEGSLLRAVSCILDRMNVPTRKKWKT